MAFRGTVYIDNLKFWGFIYLDETSVVVCDVTYNNPVVSGKIKFKDIIGLHSTQKNDNIIIKLDYCRYKGTSKSRVYKRIIFVYPLPDFTEDDSIFQASVPNNPLTFNTKEQSANITNTVSVQPLENEKDIEDIEDIEDTKDTESDMEDVMDTKNTESDMEDMDTKDILPLILKQVTKNNKVFVKISTSAESDDDSDEEWDLIDSSSASTKTHEISEAIGSNHEPKEQEHEEEEEKKYNEEQEEEQQEEYNSNLKENVPKETDLDCVPLPYEWYEQLKEKLELKHKKFLFVINPVAGKGSGYDIYKYVIKPILINAKIDYDVEMTTENVNSTSEILLNRKDTLDEYDALIGIGGDGTIANIFKSLHFIGKLDIPVSCIPAGSGNGISKCITEKYKEDFTPLNCFFRILKGDKYPMDLSLCSQGDKQILSFLSQSWGLASEVDIDSEPLRFLGSFRFTLATFWKLVKYQNYPGTLSYTHINGEQFELTDKFIMVWACQLPWVASDMKLSPSSTFNDRCIYLFIMREGMSRYEMLSMFMGAENGSHVNIKNDNFEIIPVSSYTLTPTSSASYITIDGEKVNTEKMSVSLLPEVGYIYC